MKAGGASAGNGFDMLRGGHRSAGRRPGDQDATALRTRHGPFCCAGGLRPLVANQQTRHFGDALAGPEREQLPGERIQLGVRGADGQRNRSVLSQGGGNLALILRPACVFDEAAELLSHALHQRGVAPRPPYRLQVYQQLRGPIKPCAW